MAILDTALLEGLRGQIGKQLVSKRNGDNIAATRYPDMSREHLSITPPFRNS